MLAGSIFSMVLNRRCIPYCTYFTAIKSDPIIVVEGKDLKIHGSEPVISKDNELVKRVDCEKIWKKPISVYKGERGLPTQRTTYHIHHDCDIKSWLSGH